MTEFPTGNGADWLDLLATHRGRYRSEHVDLLSDAAALRAWFAEHGMEPLAAVTPADVEATRTLRESLHRLVVATVDGRAPDTQDVSALGEALAEDRPLRVRRTGPHLRVARPADAAVARAWLARQAATDLAGTQNTRLRACDDETCSGIFLDHSGRRRWCSDERCGVRAGVRAHRARARSRGTEPGIRSEV
jgi:predicted RNA-binding Zn ribbon-like protein